MISSIQTRQPQLLPGTVGLPSSIRPTKGPRAAASVTSGPPAGPHNYPSTRGRDDGSVISGRIGPPEEERKRSKSLGGERGRTVAPLRDGGDTTQRSYGTMLQESAAREEPPSGPARTRSGRQTNQALSSLRSQSRNRKPHDNTGFRSDMGHYKLPSSPTSSSTSGGSSIWERRPLGSTSSASSTEGYEQDVKESTTRSGINSSGPNHDSEATAPTWLWDRVTTVTSNVKNIVFHSGEFNYECTNGNGESELSIVMKQYWIARVKKPQDLPDWLFTDYERQVDGSSARKEPIFGDQDSRKPVGGGKGGEHTSFKPAGWSYGTGRPGGTRPPVETPSPKQVYPRAAVGGEEKLSRATTRLRALAADRKRGALV